MTKAFSPWGVYHTSTESNALCLPSVKLRQHNVLYETLSDDSSLLGDSATTQTRSTVTVLCHTERAALSTFRWDLYGRIAALRLWRPCGEVNNVDKLWIWAKCGPLHLSFASVWQLGLSSVFTVSLKHATIYVCNR